MISTTNNYILQNSIKNTISNIHKISTQFLTQGIRKKWGDDVPMKDGFPKEYLERLLESKRQIEKEKEKIRKKLIEIKNDFPDTLEEPEKNNLNNVK